MKKSFMLYLLLIIILSFNLSNAQWVKVYPGGSWCFANDGNFIYAGLSGGLFSSGDTIVPRNIIRSSDDGTSWVNVSFGVNDQINQAVYYPGIHSLMKKDNKIFAGTDNGIFVSSNHGDSWTQLNFSSSNGEVLALIVKDSIIFAGTDVGDVLRVSVDCHKGGIFRSTDDGGTWIQDNSGLRDNCCDTRVYALTKIGNTLFEGSWLGNLCLSTNNGEIWIPIAYTWEVTSFAVIDSTLFVGGWSPSVFRTTDKGLNWTRCESGLTDSTNGGYAVNAIVASGKNLFVGTDIHGVFLSTDQGESWKSINDNLGSNYSANKDISSLAVIDKYLFAGTGGGLWRRPLSDMTAVNKDPFTIPNEFKLEQNYPNPFNPSTTIDFSIPRRSFVTITIFDVLGRKVSTLVNSEIDAGNHQINFNGSSFSSGIYFYELKADDYITNKKMILMK